MKFACLAAAAAIAIASGASAAPVLAPPAALGIPKCSDTCTCRAGRSRSRMCG